MVLDGKMHHGLVPYGEGVWTAIIFAGSGNTPLHYASSNNQLEVLKVLLAHPSIDVNVQDGVLDLGSYFHIRHIFAPQH